MLVVVAIIGFVAWFFLGYPSTTGTTGTTATAATTATTAVEDFKARPALLRKDKWIRDWGKNAECDIKKLDGQTDTFEGVVYLTHWERAYVAEFTYRYGDGRWRPFKTLSKAGLLINNQVEAIMTGRSQPEPGNL